MKLFQNLTPYLISLFILLSLTCLLGAGRADFSARFCLAMALGLWLYRVFYRKKSAKWAAFCCRTFIAGFTAFALSFCAVQGLIRHTQLTSAHTAAQLALPADAAAPPTLIVFGAALRGDVPTQALSCRLEAAYDFLTTYPDGVAVLSGGMGARETITEAAAMSRWLTARGIDPARLIPEEQSRNTVENIAFSLPLIDPDSPVIAVSNGFHLYRIDHLPSREGVEAQLLSARMPNPGLVVSMAIREYFAIGKMWLFEII